MPSSGTLSVRTCPGTPPSRASGPSLWIPPGPPPDTLPVGVGLVRRRSARPLFPNPRAGRAPSIQPPCAFPGAGMMDRSRRLAPTSSHGEMMSGRSLGATHSAPGPTPPDQ